MTKNIYSTIKTFLWIRIRGTGHENKISFAIHKFALLIFCVNIEVNNCSII